MALFELDEVFAYQDANDIKRFWANKDAPESPGDGEVYLDINGPIPVLKRWDRDIEDWVLISEVKAEDVLAKLNTVADFMWVGPTAPADPASGFIWLDTAAAVVVFKRYDGSAWQEIDHLDSAKVLAKVKEVDGPGSLLDADTVDGLQAASFLRSDADDTFSGVLTSTITSGVAMKFDNGDSMITVHDGNGNFSLKSGVDENQKITVTDGGSILRMNENGKVFIAVSDQAVDGTFSNSAYLEVTGTGVEIEAPQLSVLQGGAGKLKIDAAGNVGIGTDTPTAKLDVNGEVSILGNTAWHAGNHGSGSGLDADTLDGTQGSGYIKKGIEETTDGRVIFEGGVHTWDNVAYKGALECQGADDTTAAIMAFRRPGVYGAYFGLDTDNAWKVGGWSMGNNRYKLWHEGNDGSGSGLDADTLDGTQGSGYIKKSVEETTSGRVIFAGGDHTWDTAAYRGALECRTTNGDKPAIMTFHRSGAYATYFGLDTDNHFKVGGWSMGANKYKLWHEGNDGSGSGLDADKLDGFEADRFLMTGASQEVISIASGDLNDLEGTGFYRGSSMGNSPDGSTNWFYIMHLKHSAAYKTQIAWNLTGSTSALMFMRVMHNTVWGSWYKVWTQTTDGAGSGLDADTVDGLTSSKLVQTTGTQTVAGTKTFTGKVSLSNPVVPLSKPSGAVNGTIWVS